MNNDINDRADDRVLKEEALRKPRNRKNVRRRAFYILIIAGALIVFATVAFSVLFRVDEIAVSGSSVYDGEELAKAISVSRGDSLFTFDAKQVEQSLKESFPYIKTVSVSRKLPSSVEITVTDSKPVFYIQAGEDWYILSEDFKVLERRAEEPYDAGLVKINTGYVKHCVTGDTLSFSESKLLASLDELWQTLSHYELSEKVKSIDASNRFDIYFSYEGRIRVYIGSMSECDMKIRFFIGIMEYIYDDQSGTLDISNIKEATFMPE